MSTTDNDLQQSDATSDPTDVYLGARLRQKRSLLGLSQEQVAKALGVSFQQIQKYERGSNRMSASSLYKVAELFKVPLNYFFDGARALSPTGGAYGFAEGGQESLAGTPDNIAANDEKVMERRETLELIRAYYSITDEKQRKRVFELIKAMAESP